MKNNDNKQDTFLGLYQEVSVQLKKTIYYEQIVLRQHKTKTLIPYFNGGLK